MLNISELVNEAEKGIKEQREKIENQTQQDLKRYYSKFEEELTNDLDITKESLNQSIQKYRSSLDWNIESLDKHQKLLKLRINRMHKLNHLWLLSPILALLLCGLAGWGWMTYTLNELKELKTEVTTAEERLVLLKNSRIWDQLSKCDGKICIKVSQSNTTVYADGYRIIYGE